MLVDAHAHVDWYPLDRHERALEEIDANGIITLSVTTTPRDLFRLGPLASRSARIIPCFGVHPRNAYEHVHNLQALDPLIEDSRVLGEIGLDYKSSRDEHLRGAQVRVLEHFLSHAASDDKVVNVHCHGAETEVTDLLEKHGVRRVIVHGYGGSTDALRRMVENGYYVSVGFECIISKGHQDIVRAIPADRLLTETNNPVGLERLAGSWGMPSLLRDVLDMVGRLLKVPTAEVERRVEENFRRLMGDEIDIDALAGAGVNHGGGQET